MTNQQSFDFARARTTDPETSHKAAKSIGETANKHYHIIYDCLMDYGALGKDGISKITGLESNQISRRLPEMQKIGWVELTGAEVLSKYNKAEREWKAIKGVTLYD